MASKKHSESESAADRKRGAEVDRTSEGHAPESNVLERGDVFFFYRPAAADQVPSGLLDVNRFHMVLRPADGHVLRYITIGKKKLPDEGYDARNWAFVDGVFEEPEALRQVLSASAGAGSSDWAARASAVPAGEGVYALVRRGRNTVLAYALELPEEPGEVQRAFNIAERGQFTVAIKNPEAPTPLGLGLDESRKARFSDELCQRFGSRKWVPAAPPEFLDYEGAELILIADDRADGTLEEFDLEPEPEDEASAEIIRELHLSLSSTARKALFEGTWA